MTAYSICRSGGFAALLELSALMDEPEHSRYKHWAVQLAVRKLKHVLPVFSEQYPEDQRPHEAVTAAETWLADGKPVSETMSESMKALLSGVTSYNDVPDAIGSAVHRHNRAPAV